MLFGHFPRRYGGGRLGVPCFSIFADDTGLAEILKVCENWPYNTILSYVDLVSRFGFVWFLHMWCKYVCTVQYDTYMQFFYFCPAVRSLWGKFRCSIPLFWLSSGKSPHRYARLQMQAEPRLRKVQSSRRQSWIILTVLRNVDNILLSDCFEKSPVYDILQ